MNFHRKLLLSEVEVLQLTPLEHLRFRKNRNSSGLLTEKNVLHIKSAQLSARSLHCMFQFVLKENAMGKEEEEGGGSGLKRRSW